MVNWETFPLGESLGILRSGAGPVVRSDQEVSDCIDRRIDSRFVIQTDELGRPRSIERPDRWFRALGLQTAESERDNKGNEEGRVRSFHLV